MPQESRTIIGPDAKIEFRYLNWRGYEHVYVIEVECFEWMGMVGQQPHSVAPRTMVLHGRVITRDGDERLDMGPTRRRSFLVSGLFGVRRVD